MLTLYDEYLNQAMEAGARGYLLKDIRREELLDAIRRVYSGEVIVSESIQSKNKFMTENPESEDSGSTIEEIQLVLTPPVDAGQLMRFAGQAEEKLKSRVMQMVGAWEEGTVMTLSLNEATALSTVVSMFRDIPEIDDIGEHPLQNNVNPRLLKKATAVPKMGSKARATLFVTLCKN
jgi:hypothetical protein